MCGSLSGLESLDLSANPFPDHALSKLGECSGLRSLNLSNCESLSDAGLLHLPKTLRELSLSGYVEILVTLRSLLLLSSLLFFCFSSFGAIL